MNKALITGATGFIGSALVKKLSEKNVKVYIVGRNEKKLNCFNENVVPIMLDFESFSYLDHLVNDDIDVFYHLAWNGGFTTAFKDYELQLNNAKVACDAMSVAAKMHVNKFVYGGTINEIEIKQYLNDPDYIPRYTCIHASAKVAGDMICRTIANVNSVDYCTALIPMPFGIGNSSSQVLNVLMKNCYRGKSTKLITGDNLYDIVHVDDVANALYFTGEYGINGKSYYLGHRKLKTFKENMQFIKDSINCEAPLLFGEYPEALNIDYNLIDVNALYNDTGYDCPPVLKEKIIETAKWLVAQE